MDTVELRNRALEIISRGAVTFIDLHRACPGAAKLHLRRVIKSLRADGLPRTASRSGYVIVTKAEEFKPGSPKPVVVTFIQRPTLARMMAGR